MSDRELLDELVHIAKKIGRTPDEQQEAMLGMLEALERVRMSGIAHPEPIKHCAACGKGRVRQLREKLPIVPVPRKVIKARRERGETDWTFEDVDVKDPNDDFKLLWLMEAVWLTTADVLDREILRYRFQGDTDEEIAQKIGLVQSSVTERRKAMKTKLKELLK